MSDSTKLISQSDLKDTMTHGIKLPYGVKMRLFREAGKRQYEGGKGNLFNTVPISELIIEAITEELGMEIEPPPEQPVPPDDKGFAFLLHIPRKLRAQIEVESKERKVTGEPNASMNALILNAIEKKFGSG